jgi:hypothetical protein
VLTSGMLRHVALVRADVLEQCTASIIRVTRIRQLGTLAVTRNQSTHVQYFPPHWITGFLEVYE